MLLRRGPVLPLLALAAAGPLARPSVGGQARPVSETGLEIEHTPPACFLAERVPRLVACLKPRSRRAALRVLFRAEGDAAFYAAPLGSDAPCYSGLLPRPSASLARVVYALEAEGPEGRVRTAEFEVAVAADAASCSGRPAPVAGSGRATWEAPPGAPRTPPGFEGTRAPTAPVPSWPVEPASSPRGAAPSSPTSTLPPVPRPAAPPGTAGPPPGPAGSDRGHGLRNAAIVVGTAAAGGAAVALARRDEGTAEPAPSGSGLPPTGVSGVYVGTETINYSGGCVGTDDVVLSLQEAGGTLSGVLTFTVRICACCAGGRGANPVSGSLTGTSLQLTTPSGFSYAGTFAGMRLSGSLAGPGSVTGSWTVDKR